MGQGVRRPSLPVPGDEYDKKEEARFRRLVEQFMVSVGGRLAEVDEDIDTVESSIPTVPTEVLYETWDGSSVSISEGDTGNKTTVHTLAGASVNGIYNVYIWWYVDTRASTGLSFTITVDVDPDGGSGYSTYDALTLGEDDVEMDLPVVIPVQDANVVTGGKIRLTLSKTGTVGTGDDSILTPLHVVGL